MINKQMNDKSKNEGKQAQNPPAKPNEVGGFYFSSSVKIFWAKSPTRMKWLDEDAISDKILI